MTMQINNLASVNSQRNANISHAIRNAFKSKYWVPFSAAILCSSYAYAISLTDIKINSNLGEPLDATVFLTGVGNTRIASNCVNIIPQSGADSLPGIRGASTSINKVANGYAVRITSSSAVTEPIAAITVASACNSLPTIQRTYTVMIDPAGVTDQRIKQAVAYRPINNTRTVDNFNTYVQPVNRNNPSRAAIRQGSNYIVQAGDTLSAIAAKVRNTPRSSTWSIAASIYANNPQVFINGDPNFIELGSSIAIPTFDSDFRPNEQAALNSLLRNKPQSNTPIYSATSSATSSATIQANVNTNANNPAVNYVSSNEAIATLPTMTLSTQLSALSLQRIEARANGQVVSDSLLPNTSSLFGENNNEDNPRTPLDTAATSIKQVAEPKVVYVDRPAYPSEVEEKISAGIAAGISQAKSESGFSFGKSLTGLLASLVALGLLSWKFIIPFIKRKNRIAFIGRVRAHKQKAKYVERNKQRREALNRLPGIGKSLATEIEELSDNIAQRQADSIIEKSPFETEEHAAEIEAAFSPATQVKPTIQNSPGNKDDSQAVINKNNGPRKANVAEKIYEVGMIDDTGELASLTMAFPELEAELNARLGGDIPDLGKDLVEQKEADTDTAAETMTVQLEKPFGSSLDFELPGILDNEVNVEDDFENIVNSDTDRFSSTMVFNDQLFSDKDSINPFDEDSRESPTLSTEAIEPDAETRVSEVMVDEDGLKASDFGLNDEDFSMDKEDYSYLEPDASIETQALKLTEEELDAIGLADDDNIIPFSKKSKAGKN